MTNKDDVKSDISKAEFIKLEMDNEVKEGSKRRI